MKHTFKDWMIAVRPWSTPASAMPIIVTLAYLFWKGAQINWLYGLWALVGMILFHYAGNVWSDWFDFRKKVDAEDTYGAKTLTTGMFSPKEILWLAVELLVAAVACGLGDLDTAKVYVFCQSAKSYPILNYCTFCNSWIYFLLPYEACSGSLRYFVCGAQPYPKTAGLTISTVIPRAAIIL